MPPFTPPMPKWAIALEHSVMVKGDELKAGDVIRFSENAYPRVLWKKLDGRRWSVTVEKRYTHQHGEITIDSWRYYVVQRPPAPVLEYIRVDGNDLEPGDVVDFTAPGKPTRHLVIVEISESEYRAFGQGQCREATLRVVGTDEEIAHTFCNFSLMSFNVVGGPKLDAARQDTMLIKKMPIGYHWLGGRLKVAT